METNKKKKTSAKKPGNDVPKKKGESTKRKKKPSVLDEFDEFNDIDFDLPEPMDGFYDDEDDDLY